MREFEKIQKLVRDVPDFPKPGVLFKDITPVLNDAQGFKSLIGLLASAVKDWEFDRVLGIESRGFILGSAFALHGGYPFVPIRKPGKLPGKVKKETYQLEYGTDSLEIHEDSLKSGERILIIDDVLATGGTLEAASRLASGLGAEVVGSLVFLEIGFLKGREKIKNPVKSLWTV